MRLLLTLFLISGCASTPGNYLTVRYHIGDNPKWADPDWDDSIWLSASLSNLPDSAAVLWIRFITPVPQVQTPGLTVTGAVAREVYWDGILIGEAGTVGTNYETEQPGPIDATFRVPDSLATPGTHQVAIRLSSFRRPPTATGLLMNIDVGDFTELRTAPLRSVGIPLLFLGGFVLIALYYGALFLGDRRRLPYLFTTLLCLAVSLLLVIESWRPAIGYTYDLHTTRIAFVDLFTGVVGLLLSITFVSQFTIPGRWKVLGGHLSGVVLALVFINDHETGTYTAFTMSLVGHLVKSIQIRPIQ